MRSWLRLFRSIASNAKSHVKKSAVVNLDLKDFFPSITGDRIHGLFRKDPFFFPEDVTNLLTELVCNNGTLPQGAPTSPILSNMICYRLDKQLINYAAKTDLYTHDMPTILLFHLQADMP